MAVDNGKMEEALRKHEESVDRAGRDKVGAITAHLEATIQKDSLRSHWEGLEVLFRSIKTPREILTMKRAFYAGASSMMAVMKAKVVQPEQPLTDEQGAQMMADLAAEAVMGLIEAVLEERREGEGA